MFFDETVELTDTYVITKKFKTPIEFDMHINERVKNDGIGYIDAVINFCGEEGIDIESVSPLIGQNLKDKIRIEAEENNLMKVKTERFLFE